ncbi:hypothetical protein BST81_09105 [Leptolyngbya sp. 'hensonii']|uniref:ParM/StbA family protein n=1 Tax=Leptolyngbya sp. 'hensonii' TaxID=1922337 RepID=UPI00094F9D03|nr:hypothetical protein [Leptolyngbya sp. 'hensonii']OLP18730.1 hypothetical protein BST81_09105 [Leptolyngbya sp. 'hensonii']
MPTSPPLSLFVDLGSSLIKVLYFHEEQPRIFLMSPKLCTLSAKRLENLLDANSDAPPEDLAWVQQGEDWIAVGTLAEQLNGSSAIKQRKAEQGLVRVLGVLGILQETLNLPAQFQCNLGIALPVAEYADRESFAQLLEQEARQYSFRGRPLQVEFTRLDIQIEGMGLVRDRRAELLSQNKSASSLKIVALMFGHRNLSVLTFAGSTLQLESSTSSGPGFVKAVEVLARELSVEPTTEGLVEIVALGKQTYRFEGSLKPRSTIQAVAEARGEYWRMVADHLQGALPGGEFEIVAAGGALPVIKAELVTFFEQFGLSDHLSFADRLQKQLSKALAADPLCKGKLEDSLTIRLLDAFVGLQTLLLKVKQQPAQTVARKAKVSPPSDDQVIEKFSAIL